MSRTTLPSTGVDPRNHAHDRLRPFTRTMSDALLFARPSFLGGAAALWIFSARCSNTTPPTPRFADQRAMFDDIPSDWSQQDA